MVDDYSRLTGSEIGKALAEKTLKELSQPIEEEQSSRNWQDPEGYRYLFPWSNGILLRCLIRIQTDNLPNIEVRRKKQLDDAGRSFVRNIEEGFKRPTTKEYLEFLGFSQGSLEEVKGDIREMTEDGFLMSKKGSSLKDVEIDLKEFNFSLRKKRQQYSTLLKEGLKDNLKGSPNFSPSVSSNSSSKISSNSSSNLSSNPEFYYQDIRDLYPPLKKIKANELTYEIFTELVNKLPWAESSGFSLASFQPLCH